MRNIIIKIVLQMNMVFLMLNMILNKQYLFLILQKNGYFIYINIIIYQRMILSIFIIQEDVLFNLIRFL